MTATTPMTREELLELAALDTFGLLDEYEAALYTRSFHHAPAAVQDEVRELQAAFAAEQTLLPNVTPRRELRELVVRAVSDAIEAESIKLAPLAMIGRATSRRRETTARFGFWSQGAIWRAAAFVLAGAVIVAAYFAVYFRTRSDDLTEKLISIVTIDQVEKWAPGAVENLNDPSAQRIALRPPDATSAAYACIVVNEETKSAYLFAVNLPKRREYTVTGVAPNGEKLTRRFTTENAICGVDLGELSAGLFASAASASWTITSAAGEIVLRA